ncbi:MAG TPA: amidase [Mycobacteriales bacterium]|nr:amidase [Mycobacteriales bacterium]
MRNIWAQPHAPSISTLVAQVRAGTVDPVALLEQSLARLAECDEQIGAFVLVEAAQARAEAHRRAVAVRRGDRLGPLHGIPVGVKDLFDVRGQVTRAGSQVPAGAPAASDAAAVARLRDAGAVVVGRTRTHEFAWGMTTQHERLGGTRNPWDTDRVPGGSSGGSAAAVAAGIVPLALGTDTGCSIRLPALWCGLVGHKPSHGLVPLDGVVPLAPSLDHGGALVRDVADARLVLAVLSGVGLAPPAGVRGLRLGVAAVAGPATPSAPVGAALATAVDRAARAGVRPRPVQIPDAEQLPALYGEAQAGEALSWHRSTGRWPAHAASYGPDVRRRLEYAEQVTPERAAAGAQRRQELRAAVSGLFDTIDLLVLPIASGGPPRIAAPQVVDVDGHPIDLRDAVLPWTALANLCGLPACAVPIGLDPDGLPLGVQVVGPPGADARVLDLAAVVASPSELPAGRRSVPTP